MDVEELGGAPVKAHTFALVQFAFPVFGGDALLLAGLRKTDGHDMSAGN